MFETRLRGSVLEIARPETVWLSTGWRGGRRTADAAYSVTVPEGWNPEDLPADVARRLTSAGVAEPTCSAVGREAPVLLIGVDMRHARGARLGPVEAFATAGVSNPAALPMDPDQADETDTTQGHGDSRPGAGTVNVVVGTTAALTEGALANLVAVAAEAKAATLLDA
ncbi:MAG: adenosylcobinamide amidohydrolase, partial [Haloferacaceae archaeon]